MTICDSLFSLIFKCDSCHSSLSFHRTMKSPQAIMTTNHHVIETTFMKNGLAFFVFLICSSVLWAFMTEIHRIMVSEPECLWNFILLLATKPAFCIKVKLTVYQFRRLFPIDSQCFVIISLLPSVFICLPVSCDFLFLHVLTKLIIFPTQAEDSTE